MKIKQIILLTILALGQLMCLGQTNQTKKEFERVQLKTQYDSQLYVFNADGKLLAFDTTKAKGIIIQNSMPKGGRYTDSSGKNFGYGIFWTRVINEAASPLEITINFPADSFTIFPQPDSYLKLFLPPDTMTLDKESLYDYGATSLKSFLDSGLNKPTMLQKIINPKEEYLFYIGVLFHVPNNGPVRTGLVSKEEDLYYRISIDKQLDSAFIPCGHIITKK